MREGRLEIFGRADRQVKVLGELVDLDALEAWWRGKLGVEVALVALPEARRGRVLYLVMEGDGEWKKWNGELVGPARVEERVVVGELPRSGIGKVDRGSLERFILARKSPAGDEIGRALGK